MTEPEVVRLMRQYKAALLAREKAQMATMARRWHEVELTLEAQIAALAQEAATLADGRSLSPSKLYEMERYQRLLAQLHLELRQYARYAEHLTKEEQKALAKLGVDHAAAATQASYSGIGAFFDRLPVEAVELMAGLAGDGSPLHVLLDDLAPDAARGLTRALLRGTALGRNPRRVAREMADGMALGLQRALVIARTEQLRVYREASRQQYAASGVVRGYKRLSAHDSRVCVGCLAADGWEYELDEPFASHPQCRCTTVPLVVGVPDVEWKQGAAWFEAQPPTEQQEILGPTRYELWRRGAVAFRDFATIRHNETWGDAVVPTPVGKLK